MKSFTTFIVAAVSLLLAISVDAAVDACTTRPTLRLYSGYSSRGTAHLRPAVRVVQTKLNEKNNAGLAVDGYFGSKTDSAVRDWQAKKGLVVDGIVGRNTWASLCDEPPECDTNNPYGPSKKTTGWTPRAQFVDDAIDTCFDDRYWCGGSTRPWNPSSDHYYGNALDCYPGTSGVKAVGADKTAGDALAAWAIANAADLKIRYIIWYSRIWNIERAGEGWRQCGTSAASCNGSGDIVLSHYDHIHISVYGS